MFVTFIIAYIIPNNKIMAHCAPVSSNALTYLVWQGLPSEDLKGSVLQAYRYCVHCPNPALDSDHFQFLMVQFLSLVPSKKDNFCIRQTKRASNGNLHNCLRSSVFCKHGQRSLSIHKESSRHWFQTGKQGRQSVTWQFWLFIDKSLFGIFMVTREWL